eukprot:gene19809-23729_t
MAEHRVILIAGDTGCGKSTQVPQYLLESGQYNSIVCTQPRRIAAIALATRVACEREASGQGAASEIAYQIRFESSKEGTAAPKVLFATEGIVLRQMMGDPLLSRYDVIVVDEVHERHLFGDLLLGLLKLVLEATPSLRVVLMSATINIDLFSSFFSAPVVRVPGRLHPIDVLYIAPPNAPSKGIDAGPYLAIMSSIDTKYNGQSGDMLVFMPGTAEIDTLVQAIRDAMTDGRLGSKWLPMPLHASLSLKEQDRVFDTAPEGRRKAIISTNIAETSVTIDGIRFVIDSGRVKEMAYDAAGRVQRLSETAISRASAEQRSGRAGRTGPGICYRLYSRDTYDALEAFSQPEIHRTPLEAVALHIVGVGHNPRTFPYIEPPAIAALDRAISRLVALDVLREHDNALALTRLGKVLAQVPVDVQLAKMLVFACIFHVVEPVLTIVAAMTVASPFVRGVAPDILARRRGLYTGNNGDLFALLAVFDAWIDVKSTKPQTSRAWARSHGIEEQYLYEIVKQREQFKSLLLANKLIEPDATLDEDPDSIQSVAQARNKRRAKSKLREMKMARLKRQRKRKIIDIDDDQQPDEEEDQGQDERQIEMELRTDVGRLQSASSTYLTSIDTDSIKLILCTGLYPNVAVADEFNAHHKETEAVFHTKQRLFNKIHPTSIVMPPEIDSQTVIFYQTLLQTNKPYLTALTPVNALHTLLLVASRLDLSSSCKRIVVDGWLEIHLDSAKSLQLITAVVHLRTMFASLVDAKLLKKTSSIKETVSTVDLQIDNGQQLNEKVPYKNTKDAFKRIMEEEGWTSLYSGLKSALIGIGCSSFVYYYWYSLLKSISLKAQNKTELGTIQNLFIAALSGAANVLTTLPVWVVNTRLQLKSNRGIVEQFKVILRDEGIGGLYNGLVPALILGSLEIFVLGAIAKLIAESPYKGTLDAIVKIFKNDGFLGFFKGMPSKMVQTVLGAAFMFLVKERIVTYTVAILFYLKHSARQIIAKRKLLI